MKNDYYIYFHINPLKNCIFYIGKGRSRRAYTKFHRSELWHNTVNKYGYIINIIEEGLTNEEACEREKFWIKRIGRKDLGLGNLVNHTDGGDGLIGLSKEARIKISISHKLAGIKPPSQKGVKRTQSSIKKQIPKISGASNYAAKKVIDTNTGIIYNCVKDVSKQLKLPYSSLVNKLNGNRPNKTSLRYYFS